MPEKWWTVVTPESIDAFGTALSRVTPFLSANPGIPKSAGEFWIYLCDRDSFFCVEGEGTVARALSGPDAGQYGFEFARLVFNRAGADHLCRKIPDEDMWVLNPTTAPQ